MAGWMDTIPGLTAGFGLSPFTGGSSIGAAIGTAAGSSGGLSGTSSHGGGLSPQGRDAATKATARSQGSSVVTVEGPLNTIYIDDVPFATPVSNLGANPFNSGNMGLPPVHRNKNDVINEIVKNAPPPDKTKDLSKIPEDAKSDLRKYLEWEDKKDREDPENVRYKIIDWAAGIPKALHAKGKEVGVGIGESGKGALSGVATGLGKGASKNFGDPVTPNIAGVPQMDMGTILMLGGGVILLLLILKR